MIHQTSERQAHRQRDQKNRATHMPFSDARAESNEKRELFKIFFPLFPHLDSDSRRRTTDTLFHAATLEARGLKEVDGLSDRMPESRSIFLFAFVVPLVLHSHTPTGIHFPLLTHTFRPHCHLMFPLVQDQEYRISRSCDRRLDSGVRFSCPDADVHLPPYQAALFSRAIVFLCCLCVCLIMFMQSLVSEGMR